MKHYVSHLGPHYVGARQHRLDLEVPARPSPVHIWQDGAWALDPSKVQEQLEGAVQAHLDTEAGKLGYDGILSACSYATSSHPRFGAEGAAFLTWRDAVWAQCYAMLAEVQAGLRGIPTAAEVLAALPLLVM